MTGSGRYGLLVGLTLFPLMNFGPRPVAPVAVGALFVVQLVVAGVLTWRRTGLRLASASMFAGAVAMALYAHILIVSPDFFAAPPAELVAFGVLLLLGLLLLFAQPRTAPETWRRWRLHEETATVADYLRFRHIPELRGTGSGPGM